MVKLVAIFAGSVVALGSLFRSELSYRFHITDSLSDSESGSWAWVPGGQLFWTEQ